MEGYGRERKVGYPVRGGKEDKMDGIEGKEQYAGGKEGGKVEKKTKAG